MTHVPLNGPHLLAIRFQSSLRRLIQTLSRRLTRDERLVLTLAWLEELSLAEIARLLNRAEEGIHRLYARGLDSVLALLADNRRQRLAVSRPSLPAEST